VALVRRRLAHVCEWQHCTCAPVGFRMFWREGTLIVFWFCRPHQRRWDRGVRRRWRRQLEADAA
jgi:hypothetical protein